MTEQERFVDNGDETVTDREHGVDVEKNRYHDRSEKVGQLPGIC